MTDPKTALVRRVRTPEQVRELVGLVAAGYRLESAVWDAHWLLNVAGIDRGDLPGCTFGLLDLEDLALEIDDQHDGAGALRALHAPRDAQPADGRLNVPRLREWGHRVDDRLDRIEDDMAGRLELHPDRIADRLADVPARLTERLGNLEDRWQAIEARLARLERGGP